MLKRSIFILVLLITASLLTLTSQRSPAEPAAPDGNTPAATSTSDVPPGAPGDLPGDRREKLQRRVEQMIIWELTDTMQLSPDKEAKFLDIIRVYYKSKVELTRKQYSSLHALRAANQEAAPDEKKLAGLLDDIRSAQEDQFRLEMDMQKNVAAILDVREQARFVVEWPEIMEDVHNVLEQRWQGKGHDRGDNKFDSFDKNK